MRESADARRRLGRAAEVEAAAREESGWYARYLWIFAAGQLVLVPMTVLWQGVTSAVVFGLANALLVTGLSVYATHQKVVRRGFGLRHGVIIGTWAVLFTLAVSLGVAAFGATPGFAAVAAVACALPLATGAVLELRRPS
ncbi:hypothetical protein OHS33_16345 [Streptomyces sp. NBC_00536]|uniref:hypothetical protein n=1 Tax=Streptomyces sp. NBC_00536 TaxID=2975769 RepID=UPI002E818635|nr:hypothetical protein [Streptomyces sp. NBC_00536]WUC79762.1 hypothetical protein OHS33_16345 [Streptomyces sp. NBC_00536]